MALADRGHQVFLCQGGGENYSDELGEKVHKRITTLSLPSYPTGDGQLGLDETGLNRHAILEQFGAVQPDLVVLREKPLSGMFLEVALCTAELGIPLAILDNAYSPSVVLALCADMGPIVDGLILAGPSSFHMPRPPAHLCQVSPFVELGPQSERGAAIRALGLTGGTLITVFGAYDAKVGAYDAKVERSRWIGRHSSMDQAAKWCFVTATIGIPAAPAGHA